MQISQDDLIENLNNDSTSNKQGCFLTTIGYYHLHVYFTVCVTWIIWESRTSHNESSTCAFNFPAAYNQHDKGQIYYLLSFTKSQDKTI